MGASLKASNERPRSTVKKLDMPKFNGTIEQYTRWRRSWEAHMKEENHSDLQQVRYLVEAMPPKDLLLRNRLQNCAKLEECWPILINMFGNNDLLLKNRMDKLNNFAMPKNVKSDLNKFLVLTDTWREIASDLKVVKLQHKMDHDLTFSNFIANMEKASHLRWLEYKRNNIARHIGLPNTEIFEKWIDIETQVLREIDPLDPHSDTLKKNKEGSDSTEVTCFKCNKVGHKSRDCDQVNPDRDKICKGCNKKGHIQKNCRGGGKFKKGGGPHGATHAGGFVPPKCPRCNEEHKWKNYKNEERPSTRLTNCPKFRSDSVEDRARLVEKVGGCAKCLDYTGLHKHDTCKFTRDCGVCNRGHNAALHGSSSPYCNFANFLTHNGGFDGTVPAAASEAQGNGDGDLGGIKEEEEEDFEPLDVVGDSGALGDSESHEEVPVITDNSNKKSKGCDHSNFRPERLKNAVIPSAIDSQWRKKAPTSAELLQQEIEAANTLFLAEKTVFIDQDDKNQEGISFYDEGSNIGYLTFETAKLLKLKPTPRNISVVHTGKKLRHLETNAYKLSYLGPTGQAENVLCFGVDEISGDLAELDMQNVKSLFPNHDIAGKLHRPKGKINVLLPSTYLSLFPTEMDKNGSARLYRSTLDPNKLLLAGSHPKLHLKGTDFLSKDVLENRNVQFITEPLSSPYVCHAGSKLPQGLEDFWAGEELTVNQPPRCERCRNCCRCKSENVNFSRKEAKELNHIRENMHHHSCQFQVFAEEDI